MLRKCAIAGALRSQFPETVGTFLIEEEIQLEDPDAEKIAELESDIDIRELRLFHQGIETTLLEIIGEQRRADLRFGQGEDGTIYVLTKRDGMIRAIRPLAWSDDSSHACGLGFELALLLPLLGRLRARLSGSRVV